MLDRLTKLEVEVRRLQGELDETERKVREQQERERQEAEWKARVKKAEQELTVRRAQHGELEGGRLGLAGQLAAIEAEEHAETNALPETGRGQHKPGKSEGASPSIGPETRLAGRTRTAPSTRPGLRPPGPMKSRQQTNSSRPARTDTSESAVCRTS
ncbi:hypothetical protein [Nannocystis pusilla]|uniref:hypothetical protein n=1 Tax=Nannocystis pusilla TaxID=889268 RepID=UPI003B8127B0